MAGYMDGVKEFMAARAAAAESREVSEVSEGRAGLNAVHDADDALCMPVARCVTCGQVRWRLWCHDQRKVWQWICNRCRPLVVHNHDGTIWRSDGV